MLNHLFAEDITSKRAELWHVGYIEQEWGNRQNGEIGKMGKTGKAGKAGKTGNVRITYILKFRT
jgi:hypothetical protein